MLIIKIKSKKSKNKQIKLRNKLHEKDKKFNNKLSNLTITKERYNK